MVQAALHIAWWTLDLIYRFSDTPLEWCTPPAVETQSVAQLQLPKLPKGK